MMLGLNQGFINMKAVLDPIGQPSTLSLSDGGRYQWGLEEDISLTIIRDFPTGGRIMAATSKSHHRERLVGWYSSYQTLPIKGSPPFLPREI